MPNIETLTNSSTHPLWNDTVLVPFTITTDIIILLLCILPLYVAFRQKRLFPYAIDEIIIVFSLVEMITIVITMPMGLISHYTGGWKGGKWGCLFYQAIIIWSEVLSMCLVTTMATERIVCIKRLGAGDHPTFKHHDLQKTRIRLLIVFLFSILISLFPMFGLAPSGYSHSGLSCQSILISHVENPNQYSFFIIFLLTGYFNIVICIVLISSLVAQLVLFKRRMNTRNGLVLEEGCDMERIEVKSQCREALDSTVMVIVVTVLFYLTSVPTLILVTLEKVLHSSIRREAVLYSILITNSSGIFGPLLYPMLSRRYRNQYKRLLSRVSRCLFGCPILYEDVVREILPNAERLDLHESESSNTNGANNVTSCWVSASNQISTFTKPYTESNNCNGKNNKITSTLVVRTDGGFVNGVGNLEADEEELLEETTYITHDSDEEGNNVCLSGSRLSLVSTESE